MLRLTVDVNGRIIYQAWARRIRPKKMKPDTIGTYVINETDLKIKHRYGDGAKELARKLLDLWSEE